MRERKPYKKRVLTLLLCGTCTPAENLTAGEHIIEVRTGVRDVHGNNEVDSTDACLILQKAVGKIQNFRVEE